MSARSTGPWGGRATARLARWIAGSLVSHAAVLGGAYVARANPPAPIAPLLAPVIADEIEVEVTRAAVADAPAPPSIAPAPAPSTPPAAPRRADAVPPRADADPTPDAPEPAPPSDEHPPAGDAVAPTDASAPSSTPIASAVAAPPPPEAAAAPRGASEAAATPPDRGKVDRQRYDGAIRALLGGLGSAAYPTLARRRRLEGTVVVRFTVGRNGDLLSSSVSSPAPHAVLDQAALGALRSLAFPSAPDAVVGPSFTYELPVVFRLAPGAPPEP